MDHPITVTTDSPGTPLAAVRLRLLLAVVMGFGSEILLWPNPLERPPLDWLLLIVGGALLAVVTLDLLARYQVHDLFGVLVVAGVYGLLLGMVVNPQFALVDVPRTFLTRVLGMYSLMGAQMIGLFLALTSGGRCYRGLLTGTVILGLSWGIWVRWFPVLNEPPAPAVSLPLMLLAGAVGAALVLLALWAARASAAPVHGLQLGRRDWLVVGGGLLVLLAYQVSQSRVPLDWLLVAGLLLGGCWLILWFRLRERPFILLDAALPVRPLPAGRLAGILVLFGALAVTAYNIPLIEVEGINQQTLIALGFTAYGLAWLPTVALVLGARTYIHQIQTRRM
jgi:hypothetical protein